MKHRLIRILLGLLGALLLAGTAAPAYGTTDPTAGPPRKGPPLPVEITITSVTPTVGSAPDDLAVRAVITNTTDEPITDLWVRLQRDERLDDRGGLAQVDEEQPNYLSWAAPGRDLDLALAPGAEASIQMTASLADLGVTQAGAYPVLINLNGSVADSYARVGQAAFTLPYYPTAAPVQVGWLWPLIDRPHRSVAPGLFLDDDLASSIRSGGRLDRLLGAVEQYGAAAAMTVIIDPDLVGDLVAMSAGYQYLDADGDTRTGEGSQDALDYLERLRTVAGEVPIATTAYADLDTVAVVRAGLGGLIAQARTDGTELVDEVLQTTTVSDIDWPIGGVTTEAAVAASEAAGVRRFILTGEAFGEPAYLSSDDGITESALTELPAADPASVAVVADPALQRILSDGASYAAGSYAAALRLTAELAMIAHEEPDRARNVMLAPPRRWDPSGDYLASILGVTTATPWINPVGFDEVLASSPQDRGVLQYPAAMSTEELPVDQIEALQAPIAGIQALSSAFDPKDVAKVLGDETNGVYRALSTAMRPDPGSIPIRATAIGAAIDEVRSQIRIVPPSNGSYTLSSSSAPLVFTVENNLDVAVHYRIGLDPSPGPGLTVGDTGVLQIAPSSRDTVSLPATVERSGTFSVVARTTTPDGQPLGNSVTIRVTSSAYGTVALIVTSAAFGLLLLLIGRRGIRRLKDRAAHHAIEAEAAGRPPGMDEYDATSWLDDPVAAALVGRDGAPAGSATRRRDPSSHLGDDHSRDHDADHSAHRGSDRDRGGHRGNDRNHDNNAHRGDDPGDGPSGGPAQSAVRSR